MNYWLIKSEPVKYSWDQFEKDKKTTWDGVRNYAARNNLRAMQKGDLALYYHSNEGLEIVGIAEVIKEAFQDPTTTEAAWFAVDFKPKCKLKKPVTLSFIKTDAALTEMQLIKLQRLSVSVVTAAEFKHILKLGKLNYSLLCHINGQINIKCSANLHNTIKRNLSARLFYNIFTHSKS